MELQTLRYKGDGVKFGASRKEHGNCEGSLRKQVEEKIKRVEKLLTGKSLVPDFKKLALASVKYQIFTNKSFCTQNIAI